MLLNYHSGLFVLGCCVLEVRCGSVGVVSGLQPGYYSNRTAPNLQHTATKNEKTTVVIQQHSRKILMMGI